MTAQRWGQFPDRASARRSVVRSLHPDLGGDAAEFIAALESIDRCFGGPGGVSTPRVEVVFTRSRRGALRLRARSARRFYERTRRLAPWNHGRHFLI